MQDVDEKLDVLALIPTERLNDHDRRLMDALLDHRLVIMREEGGRDLPL